MAGLPERLLDRFIRLIYPWLAVNTILLAAYVPEPFKLFVAVNRFLGIWLLDRFLTPFLAVVYPTIPV